MLCEKCGTREAVVKIIEMVNGQKVEHNFCMECVQEMGMEAMNMVMDSMMDESNPLGKLVAEMMGTNMNMETTPKAPDELKSITCPKCGTSYGEFVAKSRFGCATCYDIFGPLMNENVKNVQAGDRHIGKRPAYGWESPEAQFVRTTDAQAPSKALTPKEQIRLLENQLADAVAVEDFESAAKYRDQIKFLKNMEAGVTDLEFFPKDDADAGTDRDGTPGEPFGGAGPLGEEGRS